MSENLGDAVLNLRTNDRELDRGIDRARGKAEAVAADFDRIGGRMQNLGKNMSLALTLPIGAFGVSAVQAASDAAELQSAFDQTFGAMSGSMNAWAEETGDAMGRSTQELQKAANMFGIFFNQAAPTREAAAGLSREFSILAQDLSSFYNVDPSEAMAKLRSGLAGETEPLRDFGVFLTEATVKAKGLELGLSGVGDELTEQEKIMVRAQLIMEQTANAQGDVARTSESTSNQVRAAKAAWEELQVTLGTKLLPVITPIISRTAELLTWFGQLPAPIQTGAVALLGFAAAAGPVVFVLGSLFRGIGLLIPLLMSAGPVFAALASGMGAIVPIIASLGRALLVLAVNPVFLTIAALVGGVYLAWKNWDKIKDIVGGVGSTLSSWWSGTVKPVLDAVGAGIGIMFNVFSSVFGTQMKAVVAGLSALLRGDFKGAWEAAKTFVTAPLQAISGLLAQFVPGATQWFRQLYSGVKTWLQDRLGDVLDWVNRKIQAVGDKFKWLWDVTVGNSYVPDLVDGVSDEFGRLDSVMVKPAIDAANRVAAAFADIDGPQIDWRLADRDMPAPAAWAPTVNGDDADMPIDVQADWREGFRSSFRDGIKAALDGNLGGFFSRWLSSVAERGLDSAIKSLTDLIFGGSTGSPDASGGGIFSILTSLFAGGFWTGGNIPTGSFGIVGERGPEPVIATPRGALVRPNSSLSSDAFRPAGANVSMPITIDATGADAAGLARVEASIDRLRAEMPATIVRTVQDAGDRRIIRAGGWR